MIVAIAIISISSIPDIPTLKIHTEKSDIRLDYVIHFCQYGLLTLVAFITYSDKTFNISSGKALLLISCLMLFAVADEFHQKLIPGRSFSLKDILSNLSGIVVAAVITIVIFRNIRRRMKREVN
jgi:VanZ family protein